MRSIYYNRIIKLHTLNLGERKEYYSVLIEHGIYGRSPLSVFLTDTRIGANKYA